jgi:hypothetical protein
MAAILVLIPRYIDQAVVIEEVWSRAPLKQY